MEKYKLPQRENGLWLIDLATVIRPLSDTLYHQYREHSKDPEKWEFTNYYKLIPELREALGETPKKSSNIIARGSTFNTKFAGEPEDENTPSDTPSDAAASLSQKRAGTTSIKKDKPTKKKLAWALCLACSLRGHKLEDCWYILEHKRPDDFTYSEDHMEKIQKKVEKDKKLAARIEKLKLMEGDDD